LSGQITPVQAGNRGFGVSLSGHFNEAETPRFSGKECARDFNGFHFPKLLEKLGELIFSDPGRQIANKYIHGPRRNKAEAMRGFILPLN
jgi:hypothetical protein